MPSRPSRRFTLNWRVSKFSANGAECVEIANAEQSVLVRDSRDRSGTVLQFSPGQWSSFLRHVRDVKRNPAS
jgi:Domain of unknown function (DUF397)